MGIADRLWAVVTTIIKMNDKVLFLSSALQVQQNKFEGLTERVIRLEATLDLIIRASAAKQLSH
jgi:hypothetical protein